MKHKNKLSAEYDKKAVLLYLGLLFGSLGVLSKIVYRPIILDAQINDLGIQGFAPNLFAALSACLVAAFLTRKSHIKTMIFVSCGILTYEIEQNWTSRAFDYRDIIATVIGLVISIFVFNRQVKSKRIVCDKK